MIKKNVLVLLLMLSAALPVISAETDAILPQIDAIAAEIQEIQDIIASQTEVVEPKASIKDRMTAYLPTIDGGTKRTLQRSAALFITHNLLKKSYAPTLNWKKGFNLTASPADRSAYESMLNTTLRATSDYAYIIAKYLIDTRLEKTNNSTPAEIIEWIAGELVVVEEYNVETEKEINAAAVKAFEKAAANSIEDRINELVAAIGHRKDMLPHEPLPGNVINKPTLVSEPKPSNKSVISKAMQLVLKAASRKQLWLPEELEITQFLKTPMARWVLTASEKGKFDVTGCKFATIGMVAEKVAGDLLVILTATNKLPKFVVNLMDTDRGYDLVKDLFAKAIEDVITLTNKKVDFTTKKTTLS